MFNLYQNLNKKDETEGARRRESDVTGHDRFYQEPRPRSRRRKRPVSRRTKSAIELDTNAMLTARNYVRKNRSASIEGSSGSGSAGGGGGGGGGDAGSSSTSSISRTSSDSTEDKFHFTNKIDSLAKVLFNRVSAAKSSRDTEVSSRRASQVRNPCLENIIRFCWRFKSKSRKVDADKYDNSNGRHQYESLDQSPTVRCDDSGEYVEMEKRSRDRALSICQVYVHGNSRYHLMKQLYNVGSRVDKHWFNVRDTLLKTDRLLTLVPLNRNCPLTICPSTKDVLNKLFLALQHPYICPVLDLEFIEYEAQNYVILVQPINQGSLKDLIYGVERTSWNADWGCKYAARGKGLTLPQIQQMGRQVLEALIFLRERGFPTVTHLHSGNVVIQNGVARLAGLENSLLGFTSRIHPIVTSRADGNSTDSICFGHMLFEMCTGYELCSFRPSEVHYSDLIKHPQVADLMEVIFTQPDGSYLSVEQLLLHDLFRNIDLREMRNAPVAMFRPILSPSIVRLLEAIKRHTSGKRLGRDTRDQIILQTLDECQ